MRSVGICDSGIHPHLDAVKAEFGSLQLSVGCINSPHNVTITGDDEQVNYLAQILQGDGVFARKLPVTVAYHSKHMNAIAPEYSEALEKLSGRTDKLASVMVSSVTGDIVTPSELRQRQYWVNNMLSTVQFVRALTKAASLRSIKQGKVVTDTSCIQFNDILELGPHALLQRPVKDTLSKFVVGTDPAPRYVSALIRGTDAVQTLFRALGYLHCRGHSINIQKVNEMDSSPTSAAMRPLTNLPGYPFHSRSYWRESRISKGH
ncbi:acyl transferase domain-containing protein [Aspergillus oleicola]